MRNLIAIAVLMAAGCDGGGASTLDAAPDGPPIDPRAKACSTWLEDRAGFRYTGTACTIVTADLAWVPFSINPDAPTVYGGWVDGGPTGAARASIHAEQTAFETF